MVADVLATQGTGPYFATVLTAIDLVFQEYFGLITSWVNSYCGRPRLLQPI